MRFISLALPALAFAGGASAQYFSEGWKPGQPVAKERSDYSHPPASTAAEGTRAVQPATRGSLFDLSTYLETGPVKALFSRVGVNITEKLEAAREQTKIWDERIPLITDDSYEDLVVEEHFETLEEEKDRLWFIVISVSAAQREGISKFVDEQFDKAFGLTQEAADLSHVRWGRIDYMNVTALTTRWGIWRAPFLVVLKDRGQTLRFFRPGNIRLDPEILRLFLKQDAWERSEPWRSAFSPGGSSEFVFEYLAIALTKIYSIIVTVPRWLLIVVTGSLGSVIVNILHSSRTSPSPEPKPATGSVTSPSTPAISAGTSTPTKNAKGGAPKRKGVKK
ncbi:hypothetical protein M0805_006099 [Coniferiporia weirii]|nr:hypothetical protein M0805_006099 [Coniferiporia weirii]